MENGVRCWFALQRSSLQGAMVLLPVELVELEQEEGWRDVEG
jgi:hypothetical protein